MSKGVPLDTITALVLWILILALWNLDDNLARWMGQFAAEVVSAYTEARP